MKRVIGIGTEHRGDDAAGLEVARRLRNVDAVACGTGSLDMIELWDGQEEVVIVDAMKSGSAPGTVARFDGLKDELPKPPVATTHAFGAGEAVALARILNRLPDKITVIAIEADRVDLGAPMSRAVVEAIDRIVAELDHA